MLFSYVIVRISSLFSVLFWRVFSLYVLFSFVVSLLCVFHRCLLAYPRLSVLHFVSSPNLQSSSVFLVLTLPAFVFFALFVYACIFGRIPDAYPGKLMTNFETLGVTFKFTSTMKCGYLLRFILMAIYSQNCSDQTVLGQLDVSYIPIHTRSPPV